MPGIFFFFLASFFFSDCLASFFFSDKTAIGEKRNIPAVGRQLADRYNGKGMGAKILIAPESPGQKHPQHTTNHELGHAFLINRGLTPTDPYKMPLNPLLPQSSEDLRESEFDAVRTENIANEKYGLPLRKEYNGETVPNPEGKNARVNTLPKDQHPKKMPEPTSSANPQQSEKDK